MKFDYRRDVPFRTNGFGLTKRMEAAGIEPASSESDDASRPEGNSEPSEPGRLASSDGHEVDRLDDDPRSERGPSVETATPPGGAGAEPPGRA